jgi:hypothetical protein
LDAGTQNELLQLLLTHPELPPQGLPVAAPHVLDMELHRPVWQTAGALVHVPPCKPSDGIIVPAVSLVEQNITLLSQ